MNEHFQAVLRNMKDCFYVVQLQAHSIHAKKVKRQLLYFTEFSFNKT